MNHLRLVRDNFDFNIHGLREMDVSRADRQNFASAQRLILPKVHNCLQEILSGNGKHSQLYLSHM